MADLKSQRDLESALSGDNFLSGFLTVDQLCSRWRISDRTVRHLEESGQLKAYTLPGKAHRKHYRVTDIDKMERELRDPPADVDQPDNVGEQRVQAAIAKLEALVGRAEAIAAPAAPTPTTPKIEPVGDARRRARVLEAFDGAVSDGDRFKSIFERNLASRLDSDATFSADAVESFIVAEREKVNAVVNLLAKERHHETMSALFPSSADRDTDARVAEVRPVALPRHVVWANPLQEIPESDDPTDAVVVEPFTGFGLNKGKK